MKNQVSLFHKVERLKARGRRKNECLACGEKRGRGEGKGKGTKPKEGTGSLRH